MAEKTEEAKRRPPDRTPEKQGLFGGFSLFGKGKSKGKKSRLYEINGNAPMASPGHIQPLTTSSPVKNKDTERSSVVLPETVTGSMGRGHYFQQLSLINPTWCDKCGDFIWGVYKQNIRCRNCKYTCHRKCVQYVTLDCKAVESTKTTDDKPSPENTLLTKNTDENVKPGHLQVTSEELRRRIEKFNSESNGLILTMDVNGELFRGFIRVHMNLSRPINVMAGGRPASVFGVVESNEEERAKTSFFLPKGTVKALHISSDTTAHEVIIALLNKFRVTDNPRKFALFEKDDSNKDKAVLRRLSDYERPLFLHLLWGANNTSKTFVLQENETGNILWEAFTLPELSNFLKILDIEEEEHLKQVRKKYALYQEKIKEAIDAKDR
ncbi:ras association domain-containing protein 1-like [Ptychodera flava]|uniref:ras association domain-containing protein 1-like n=1 Tax=Ptychodera flava TaxID=63121 RepID=UPI00396AA662